MADDQTTQQQQDQFADDETMLGYVRMFVVGVSQLVLLAVPLLLIHTLRKRIEQGETFKNIEKHLTM